MFLNNNYKIEINKIIKNYNIIIFYMRILKFYCLYKKNYLINF